MREQLQFSGSNSKFMETVSTSFEQFRIWFVRYSIAEQTMEFSYPGNSGFSQRAVELQNVGVANLWPEQ